MATDYTTIDSEVLGRMVQMARQAQNLSGDELEALQKTVEARKDQLLKQLKLAGRDWEDTESTRRYATLYDELITLEPDNYKHYKEAGWWSHHRLEDYQAAVAYYTSALQVVEDDPDVIWMLYKERAALYLDLGDFARTLEDGKMALRYKYLAPKLFDIDRSMHYSYGLLYVYEGLKGTGNRALAEEIDSIRQIAECTKEGLIDELIAEFFLLLDIPITANDSADSTAQSFPKITAIKQIVSNDPVEVRKRHLRAQIHQEDREYSRPNFPKLLQLMRELITLQSTNYRYHAAAGDICQCMGNDAEAVSYYTNALALMDSYTGTGWWEVVRDRHIFQLYSKRAHSFIRRRSYEQAFADCEQALRAGYGDHDRAPYPDDITALMIFCYINMGHQAQEPALAAFFNEIFGHPLVVEKYTSELLQTLEKHSDGIGFITFSEAGIDVSMGEPTGSMRWGESPSLERQEKLAHSKAQAAELVRKIEPLLRLMGRP
ncbi:MAG: tetratricopeptide repeat protein [Caldilineaceae bacterium]|nr:tetratricopeptide repeat protein [Caldilineaceae bacterium]